MKSGSFRLKSQHSSKSRQRSGDSSLKRKKKRNTVSGSDFKGFGDKPDKLKEGDISTDYEKISLGQGKFEGNETDDIVNTGLNDNVPRAVTEESSYDSEFAPKRYIRGKSKRAIKASRAQEKLWKQMTDKIKNLELLETKMKKQIKFEVDKAYAMTQHDQFSKFLSRDPITGNSYLSLVKMCLYNTEKLTPEALMQKIKNEREDVMFNLRIDSRKDSDGISFLRFLNFLVLDNLNA